MQESLPESESVPLPAIVTGARYQPAALAARAGTAVVAGAPVSRRTVKLAVEVFPELSVQLPLSAAPGVSGPLYVLFELHEAIPEVASDPFHDTLTVELSQPFAFGAGLGAAEVAGGVES